jgi:hypothetical protein
MQIRTNYEGKRVVLSGSDGTGRYEIHLTWSQAANLATALNEASGEIEPPPPPGRTYCPAVERDHRRP